MSNIDVLMLTKDDWANTGRRFQKCLKLLGLNVEFHKGIKHIFNYEDEAPIHPALSQEISRYPIIINAPELRELVERSHVIYFMHTTYVDTGADLRKKHVVVDHGGITYRNEPGRCNEIFNPISHATINHCPDLMCLGAENEHLIYYPVDVEKFQPDFEKKGEKLVVGHFPSNPENKGTNLVKDAIKRLSLDEKYKDKFDYIGVQNGEWATNVKRPWAENIKLMRSCDVLIETCKITLPGSTDNPDVQFGEWGNTAIEAAALGKVVITNSLTREYYQREYGELGLQIANSEIDIISQLKGLMDMSDQELLHMKQKTREWVVRNHSFQATADRMWSKVLNKFFELQ